jgi:uncharacterized protein
VTESSAKGQKRSPMGVAIVVLGALLLVLVVATWQRGLLKEALESAFGQGIKIVPLVALALAVAACAEVLLPRGWVQGWLSDAAGWRGILIGWVAGALTPSGSVIGLPLVAGFARAGVGAPVLVTYLASLSTLSLMRLPMEVGLVGGRLALLRFAACVLLPPLAGVVTRGLLFVVHAG